MTRHEIKDYVAVLCLCAVMVYGLKLLTFHIDHLAASSMKYRKSTPINEPTQQKQGTLKKVKVK